MHCCISFDRIKRKFVFKVLKQRHAFNFSYYYVAFLFSLNKNAFLPHENKQNMFYGVPVMLCPAVIENLHVCVGPVGWSVSMLLKIKQKVQSGQLLQTYTRKHSCYETRKTTKVGREGTESPFVSMETGKQPKHFCFLREQKEILVE